MKSIEERIRKNDQLLRYLKEDLLKTKRKRTIVNKGVKQIKSLRVILHAGKSAQNLHLYH